MYFNMVYKNEKAKKSMHTFMYTMCLYIDFGLLFFINLVLFILGLVIYDIARKNISFEIDISVLMLTGVLLIIAEVLFVLIFEKKRRNEYVRVDHRGVYIYTGAGETFGYASLNSMGILITYDKIKGFYSSVPYNMPQGTYYTYSNGFDFIKKLIKVNRTAHSSQRLIPAIPNGKYDEKCVLLELSNGCTAVLPLEDDEKFKEYLSKYLDKYKELNEK